MAPSLSSDLHTSVLAPTLKKESSGNNKFGYKPGRTVIEDHDNYPHEDLLPSFPEVQWEPIEEIPYEDRGLQGDGEFRDLFADATDVFDYTPKIGTEVHGINLAKLNDTQRNDLARLVAVRGVVFIRGQNEFDIEAQRDLGRYLGSLHKVCLPNWSRSMPGCLLTPNTACYHRCSKKARTGRRACCVYRR